MVILVAFVILYSIGMKSNGIMIILVAFVILYSIGITMTTRFMVSEADLARSAMSGYEPTTLAHHNIFFNTKVVSISTHDA